MLFSSCLACRMGSRFFAASDGSGGGGVELKEPDRWRLDVHHHILPPAYVDALGAAAIGAPAPNRAMPTWSPQASIDMMDQLGIELAVTSISAPGLLCETTDATRRLVMTCNDYAARLRTDHPGRFAMFAALPLPDVDAGLAEIERAYDSLGAEGIGLFTNFDGLYLGDEKFRPILAELDRRKAVVYVHPTTPLCAPDLGIPASTIEFPFETTRTITSLIYSGAFAAYPHIRFIFSHAGGAVPYLAERIARLATTDRRFASLGEEPRKSLSRLYFDTALSANPTAMRALGDLVPSRQILFGTDFPFAPASTAIRSRDGLNAMRVPAAELRGIYRDNLLSLFPNLLDGPRPFTP